jgi:hypothetical protein
VILARMALLKDSAHTGLAVPNQHEEILRDEPAREMIDNLDMG